MENIRRGKIKKKKRVKLVLMIINVMLFAGLLILPTVSWIVLSTVNIFSPSVMEKLDFDTGEKRDKAQLGESDNLNEFFADFEKWYNDRVPFRSVILNTQKNFLNKIEEPYIKTIRPALLGWIYKENTDEDNSISDEIIPDFPGDKTEDITDGTFSSQHNYILVSKTEPTCLKDGIEIYRCEICGDEKEEHTKKYHEGLVVKVVEPSVKNYGYTLKRCSVCGSEYRTDIRNKLHDATYLPLITHGSAVEGKSNWLFYKGDNSLEYYQGTNLMSDSQMKNFNDKLAQLQSICDERGIKLQYMIMPNKEQVYPEFMPSIEVVNTNKRIDMLVKYVRENSGIEILYPIEELKNAKPYWQVYRKHDTHWNAAGAFIGTQALYKNIGVPVTDLSTVKISEKKITGGDLINLGGLSTTVYSDDLNYTIDYKTDVVLTLDNGDRKGNGTLFTQSTSENQCNFVMISDSFRKAMIPFLEKDFSNCTITHKNNVGNAQVKTAIRNADVLVVATIERQDQTLLQSVESIIATLSEN